MLPFRLEGSVGNDRLNRPEDIRRVAAALRGRGYLNADEDLSHGYLTRPLLDAVDTFQADHGLLRDGVLEPGGPTEKALRGDTAEIRASRPTPESAKLPAFRLEAPVGDGLESRPADVAKTKIALSDLGFLKPDASESPAGLLDHATKDAITDYQEARRLRADGWLKPGGETEDALNTDIAGRVEPANYKTAGRIFAWLGGREIRDFLERYASSYYYWLLRQMREKERGVPGSGYRNPKGLNLWSGRRGPRFAKNFEASSEVENPRRPQVFPADPPIRPEPQRGRPPEAPLKGDDRPPNPKELSEVPDREAFPQPEISWGDYILILPEPDDDLRRPMIAKMRGKPRTRALDGGVGNLTLKPLYKLAKEFPELTWEHVGGGFEPRDPARKGEKPVEKKQRYVPSINQNKQERRTTKDSSFPDFSVKLTYRDVDVYININTQDTNVDGRATGREVQQIERLNRNERGAAISIGVPKPARGEYLDPIAYQQYIENVVRTILRAIDEDPGRPREIRKRRLNTFERSGVGLGEERR